VKFHLHPNVHRCNQCPPQALPFVARMAAGVGERQLEAVVIPANHRKGWHKGLPVMMPAASAVPSRSKR